MRLREKWLVAFNLLQLVVIILLTIVLIGENKNYDISTMNEVTTNDVIKMFESNKTYVLFVGRKNCDLCLDMIDTLKIAQIKLNFTPQYLDITKVDRTSSNWKEIVDKLTLLSTQTLTEDGSGEKVTESYGFFLDKYGFTPTVIVIKNGMQSAGFIGKAKTEDFINWLSEKLD